MTYDPNDPAHWSHQPPGLGALTVGEEDLIRRALLSDDENELFDAISYVKARAIAATRAEKRAGHDAD